ncbi:MAG: Glu/Leu/Phe/Val family dehydrogenase [Candidatus Acidiferrales bacterium]
MEIQRLTVIGYEEVIEFQEESCGLHGFLAIHETTLGPALGGTRLWRYDSEDKALADALKLSRAMTYKAALAELPCGGGKTVILEHDGLKRAEAFEAYGRLVESLGGRFFTGPDVGIVDADLVAMGRTTRHAVHTTPAGRDDINQYTAMGVWHGMRACLEFAGLQKPRVAIQGVGHVGLSLGRILKQQGFSLSVADIDGGRADRAAEELGAEIVAPGEILALECDVLAPCALGGVITEQVARELRARIVCGSANNILASAAAGEELSRRGILYGPDYLVNAGGLIRGLEFDRLGRADSTATVEKIYARTRRVLELARERGLPTMAVADQLAEAHLAAARASRSGS